MAAACGCCQELRAVLEANDEKTQRYQQLYKAVSRDKDNVEIAITS